MKEFAHEESAHSRTHLSSQVAKSRHQTTHFNFPSYENSRLPDTYLNPATQRQAPVSLWSGSFLPIQHAGSWEGGAQQRGVSGFYATQAGHKVQIFLLPPPKCQEYRHTPLKPSLDSCNSRTGTHTGLCSTTDYNLQPQVSIMQVCDTCT